MAKCSGSRRELKKTKKTHASSSKENGSSIRIISSSDSDSFLSSDSERYKIIQTAENKEINKLDHVVKNNIQNNNQCDDAI